MAQPTYIFYGWHKMLLHEIMTGDCRWVHYQDGKYYVGVEEGPIVCGFHKGERVDWQGSPIHNGVWWPYAPGKSSAKMELPPKPLFKIILPLP